ncbi:CRISPR-associated protein, Cmr5 family [Thioalkalivibrio sulfidiphilus HL-EbGr7]|uniref:CRISPR type III-B/RAMP module-associated protein Cmr5 n=1 Tax=Thioalkalivibrio sulfidiphilus (strain HL-EbGR7) TaxID=396588 RepID=B8GSH2_THISH|nr:type III-B CRISPR module-associated protein Cmr5 [Thioalkalivibrio sulfidiphilus]ACL72876.1 CRISPR-associated protein, Cmr5 family [Thioalkalivibrio sulfidiphilus HL-EbGr7]
MRQTQQQRRAAHALAWVQARLIDGSIDNKALKSAANDLPALILMNGLGQAAAYCQGKDTPEHKALYGLLSEWLCGEGSVYHGQPNLLAGITAGDMHHYRLAQAEALAYLPWVKRFARAFIEDEQTTAAGAES